jgi:UDP-N-acetylmuramoylalanine--D-glutamate ligase
MRCPFFANTNVVVFGMGRTGLAAVSVLLQSQANVIAADDADAALIAAQGMFPDLKTALVEEINWQQQDYLVLSPGVPLHGYNMHRVVTLAKTHNVTVISDIDILYLACPNAQYVGITGTNGKSTTTALVGHILEKCGMQVEVGGNIGRAALSLPAHEYGTYVLELSSFQLELLKFCHLDLALLLNFTPDHLDRHGTMEQYLDAKLNVFRRLQPQGTAIFSADYSVITQPIIRTLGERGIHNVITFSNHFSATSSYIKNRVLYDIMRDLKQDFTHYEYLPGQHNEENIIAAYLISTQMGCNPAQVVEAIHTFKGLKHRMEVVKSTPSLIFINDSKATNADATAKALSCYENIYWIAGGIAKSDGIDSLIPLIREKVRLTLLIGDAQERFAGVLAQHNLQFYRAGSLQNALEMLSHLANAAGVVLFSPACASFDQFRDFEDRGEKFKAMVQNMFMEDQC